MIVARSALLDRIELPIVLAPLAGGPATPELAAAVSNAGGLGFVAAGYLTGDELGGRIARTRELTGAPFAVNVFVPGEPTDPSVFQPYLLRLADEARRAGSELGQPRFDDDDWSAKVDLLVEDPVPAVSFTFGCPPADVVARLRDVGTEVWVTVTDVDEAEQAAAAGADVLVLQGLEAGGHRASFVDTDDCGLSLLPLIQLVHAAVDVPVVATGGLATRPAVTAALAAGARAVQIGTAFLRCPEAGTSKVHREAIASATPTVLTRAFTGRLARGIANRLATELTPGAPRAYPEVHHATSALRRDGRKAGNADVVNLWAGEAHELAQALPAAEVVRALAGTAR